MNVLGEDMTEYYDDAHFAALADGWAHGRMPLNRIFKSGVFIHHYAFRTETAFTDRVARGLGGDFHGQDHWGRVAADETLRIGFTNSINAVEDLTLAKVWEQIITTSSRLAVEPVSDPPPMAAPHPPQRQAPAAMTFGRPGRIGCVVIVKNEERHIAEWLAWQFLIGFDTVLLLDNGSTDRTKEIAASFAPRYDVRVIDWPDYERGAQQRAYMHAIALLKDEFEWLAFFDADEFLVLDEGLSLRRAVGAAVRSGHWGALGDVWVIRP